MNREEKGDDIVTRLRGYDFMRDGDIPDVIMSEAADEIERLEIDLSEARDEYQKLWEKYNRRERNG
jgi:hypothetical protein